MLRSMIFCTTAALTAISLTGCIGGGSSGGRDTNDTPPEWYTQPPQRGASTMVGVGSGPNRRAAYNNAAAELARQLQLSIAVDDTTVRDYTSVTDSSKPARSERMVEEARQEVRAQAAQDGLPGVTEAEYHQGQRRDYVMVTFDRSRWANDLIARLGEIDTVLSGAADQLATVGEGPAAIALARQLLPILAERDLIAERIHVASPGTQVAPPPITTIDVQARLRALVDRLSMFLVLSDADAAMRPTLVEALASLALPVVTEASQADFRLEANVRVSEQAVDGMVRADGSADMILIHVPTNRQVAATSIEDRAAANRTDLARERLLDRLATKLAVHIDEHIVSWLAR